MGCSGLPWTVCTGRPYTRSVRYSMTLASLWHEKTGKPDIGFVFSRDDDSAIPYCSIDTQHDRTIAKLNFRFRIYDCRHTFGTRLGESRADAYTICKLMGHSNILVSQRYVHPTPGRVEIAFAGAGRLQPGARKSGE